MASPYQTAGTIVSRAAVQLGLGPVADPYASTEANVAQLAEYLSVVGDDLLREAEWTHLKKEYSFQTVLGQSLYPLPADFHQMIDQSGWNRSTRLPLGGPLSSQQWQYLKSRQVGIVFNVLFRLNPLEVELFAPTADALTIAFEYVSLSWVRSAASSAVDSAGAPVGDQSSPLAKDDLLLFDPLLLVRALKVQFLQAKGFDTTVALREYRLTLEHEIGRTDGAPTLSLNRGRNSGRMLGAQSIPITGFGFGSGEDGIFDGEAN